MQNEEFNQSGKAHSGRTLPGCDFLHFVAFVDFCSKSFVPFRRFFGSERFGVKVRASSSDFDDSS